MEGTIIAKVFVGLKFISRLEIFPETGPWCIVQCGTVNNLLQFCFGICMLSHRFPLNYMFMPANLEKHMMYIYIPEACRFMPLPVTHFNSIHQQ